MSQRVVWCAIAMSIVIGAANGFAADCTGTGTATFTLNGAATSAITKKDVSMTQSTSTIALATATAVSAQDPYPNGVSVFFANSGDCHAQFPDLGGVFIGTSITSPTTFHVVPGRYCAVTSQTDAKDPGKPRNIITLGFAGNGCPGYGGFADVSALQLVFDKNNVPLVNKFSATFTVQCTFPGNDNTPISGSIDFTASPLQQGSSQPVGTKTTAGTSPPCQSGQPGASGGGDNGGGGGGGTPIGPLNNVSFVLPDDLQQGPFVASPGQSTTLDVPTAVANGFNSDISLYVITDAKDTDFLDVTLSPVTIPAPGAGDAKLTITTHPLTFPRDYNVTLLAVSNTDQTMYTTSFTISVLCDPPKILGTQQPKGQTISSNSGNATLKVTSAGSPPFSYQWYSGMRGMTSFPVKDATGQTFTTNQDGMYWVRVSNACGSTDSEPATVTH